ncbi:MAG: hypothetical protein ACOYD0_02970 [Candidatus Nanopelagicales bacterium]
MNSRSTGVRPPDDEPDALVTDLSGQLTRTAELLRTMALPRLSLADSEGLTPTARAHTLSQLLVDLTWELSPGSFPSIAGIDRLTEPPHLPEVRAHGAGVQLAVVGREFLVAAKAALITANDGGRQRIQGALTTASQACVALRRAL